MGNLSALLDNLMVVLRTISSAYVNDWPDNRPLHGTYTKQHGVVKMNLRNFARVTDNSIDMKDVTFLRIHHYFMTCVGRLQKSLMRFLTKCALTRPAVNCLNYLPKFLDSKRVFIDGSVSKTSLVYVLGLSAPIMAFPLQISFTLSKFTLQA